MKKSLLFFAASVAAIVFSGCTTYYRDTGADYLNRPAPTGSALYYTEYSLANKQIAAKGNASVLFGVFQIAENKRCLSVYNPYLSVFSIIDNLISPTQRAVDNAKSVALYNACEQFGADQLLGVTFDYVIKNYFFYASVNCTVKGFPATVKGIKMIEKKPIILNKWQKVEYVAPYENPVVNKDDAKPVLNLDMFK